MAKTAGEGDSRLLALSPALNNLEVEMKKYLRALIISAVLLLSISTGVFAQPGYTPFAYEDLTALTTEVLTLNQAHALIAGAVFITIETNNIRYRIDNGYPSADNGHLVIASAYQNLWFNDPSSIKWFREIGIAGDASLRVTYYRRN